MTLNELWSLPPSRTLTPRRSRALGWLLASLLLLAVAQAQPTYTLDVDMLVCPDRLIFIPTITTASGTAAYTRDFQAYISDSDGTQSGTRNFRKGAELLDDWDGFDPFIVLNPLTWNSFTDAHLHISSSSPVSVDDSFPIAISFTDFAGGSGTLTDPYLIATADQLQAISCQNETQLRYYALTNDIDLAGRNFIPIGLTDYRFRGGIDGRGYTISNLSMIHPGFDRVGFIGAAKEFFLRNIRFTNPEVHGDENVGIALGHLDGDKMSFMHNVVIEGGVVRGRRNVGGLAGRTEEFGVANLDLEVDVIISTPRYHGPDDTIALSSVTQIGGVIGEGVEGLSIIRSTIDASITQDDHISSLGRINRVAGLVGRADQEVLVQWISANVGMDLTIDGIGSAGNGSAGLFGARGLDEGNVFADSDVTMGIKLTLTPTAPNDAINGFGGIAAKPEEGFASGVNLSGAITIDASRVARDEGFVTLNSIGAAFGEGGSSAVYLLDSHIDVDVTILGSESVKVERVGGIVGDARWLIIHDVRVGGAISISDVAEVNGVGALFGYSDNSPANVRLNLQSIIYRGTGVNLRLSDAAVVRNVGTLYGDLRGDDPGAGSRYTGANVYWDSDRNNGATFHSPSDLGLPATSAQLSNLTWLTTTASFNSSAWCVNDGAPAIKRVTPACTTSSTPEPTPDPITAPNAPSNLTTTINHTTIQLAWLPPSNPGNGTISHYLIQYRALGDNAWTDQIPPIPCDNPQPTCTLIPNLTPGTTYDLRVAAQNQAGQSPWSNTRRITLPSNSDVPTITSIIPGPNRGWITLAPASPNTTGYEISLDNGATWNPITPHVGNRVLRITNLTNGTTYPIRIRATRADSTKSEPTPTVTLMPTPIRPSAPELNYTLDPTTLTYDSTAGTASIELTITNTSTIHQNDLWLNWNQTASDATISDLTPISDQGTWTQLDTWWYGENIQLAPGATHRIRITLEINP
jgi:hypothetical protein